MQWVVSMARTRNIKVTFFHTTSHGEKDDLLTVWKMAAADNHEMGNYTHTGLPNVEHRELEVDGWSSEIATSTAFLTSNQLVKTNGLRGFRAPKWEYSDNLLSAVQDSGLHYDSSIEEGYEPEQDGTKSPGNTARIPIHDGVKEITPHPGLWELPLYALFVPPDLREGLSEHVSWFNENTGQIPGNDYMLWGALEMTKEHALATLKHSFDQRMKGNRAPFLFAASSWLYTNAASNSATNAVERRETMEEFLDYVLAFPEVRVVSHSDVLDWMRNPTPL
jgi:hypothetical protein